MNRKIQDTDALFIVSLYKRDQHAFNALGEATKYGVSVVTIYNVLSKAGIKMRRGRKPLRPPEPPQPLISPELVEPPPFVTRAFQDDRTRESIEAPEPLNPLDMLNLVDHLNHPKPPPFKGVDDETFARIEAARAATRLDPPSFPGLPPKSPKEPRRGPPIIRPGGDGGGFGERPKKIAGSLDNR